MTWLTQADGATPAGERLAKLWERPGLMPIPGAHNGLAAMLARRAGFEALYLSGAALSASMGLADLGIMTVEELTLFTRMICRAGALPLIVDADTGYGGILNVMRVVRELEDAGAAAIQIEDQLLPKKCGHLNDKLLASPEEAAARIAAARRARRSLRIIARTDAAASEGIDGALSRARLYIKAGADAIFPEALTEAEMFRRFAREIHAPLLANMTEFGRTPYFTARQFEEFGFKMVIWPVSSLRVAAKAIGELYAELKAKGTAEAMLDRMQTRAELYETIGYSDYESLDESVAASVVPPYLERRGQ
ncbi:MAG TPA: methylisocitrate lyase [Candidatus Binataceae bacterium]|jgi:methylisocitrate lyase|nr:methylisocitrate lyase [Candidatus Binataceae bacterium]